MWVAVGLLALTGVGVIWPLAELDGPSDFKQWTFLIPWMGVVLLATLAIALEALRALRSLKGTRLPESSEAEYDAFMLQFEGQASGGGRMSPRGWFWVRVKDSSRLDAHVEGAETPAFLTLQSLATFPGAAVAVTVIWTFLNKALGVADSERCLVIGIASGVVGLVLLIWGWASLTNFGERVGGVFLSIVNSAFLALSVLGIDVSVVNSGTTSPG
jgi:hypothetical protein